MSRSQGAANNGWPPQQRHPAAEPDPRTAGRPAQRPQQAPQYSAPQAPQGYPQQQGYAEPTQQPGGYAPPQQPVAYAPQQPGYHYPQPGQQASPQYTAQQQRPAAPAPQAAPQPANRQALSSLSGPRNGQPAQDFDNFPRTQPPQYGRQPQQPAQRAQYAAPPAPENPIDAAMMGYRQPATQAAPQYAPPRQAAAPSYEGWPPAQAPQDAYGQGSGDFLQPDAHAGYPANGGQPQYDGQHDWALPASGYVDPGLADQQAYARGGHYDHQGHGGALEPTYNQEEVGYEAEEPRRRSWTMRIAGAVVVAIGLGYGLAQAYSALLGGPPVDTGSPPVIASDTTPAKEKPEDPGGRQFSHTDSKVLGRLGENGAVAEHSNGELADSETDSNGARQVKTLVVGRDGSIEPPAEAGSAHDDTVSVPGLMVVDAFGSAGEQQHSPPPQAQQQPQPQPQRVSAQQEEPPQQRSGMNVKTTKVIPSSTASIPDEEPAAAPPKRQKVAVQTPSATPAASSGGGGGNGYVVVLASVPASGTSRLDALRKFADMQQQYGPVLGNKTPDVRETTLAGKGPYHRLLVGPPGSKAQASDLCTQLKAYGYKDCWVTAY